MASDVADHDALGSMPSRTTPPKPASTALWWATARQETAVTVSDIRWEHVVPTFPAASRNPLRNDLLAKFHQFVTGFSAINGDVAEHNRITTRPRYVPAELDAGLLVPDTAAIKDKLGTAIEDERFELFANDLGHS